MAERRKKEVPAVKPTARRVRLPSKARPGRPAKHAKPERKVFDDRSLWGALPGMGKWAFPLLKELRNE